jgi:hypothetical protein
VPVRPRDHVAELRDAIAPLLQAGTPYDVAIDKMDQNLIARATQQYACRGGQHPGRRDPSEFRRAVMEGIAP